jgi:hypothetical protein
LSFYSLRRTATTLLHEAGIPQAVAHALSLGAGKSWLLRALSIYYALAIPQLQVFIFRRTFPELISTHMSGQSSYPELVARWSMWVGVN